LFITNVREHSFECPSLSRHQNGAETAADVPYDPTKKTRKTQDRQKDREDQQRHSMKLFS
jgi:hypothetical protein